ncbi:MAG TPA: D-aminoacyl-tRNA deacylase [Candidatus Binataceae bacterium]|nr:D-aminoacyl-tRNA deacylase [Candidatus Binataceae bacterium]
MRAVLQRVTRAEVTVGGRIVGRIARGFVVLLGVAKGDAEADAEYIMAKTVAMRVFADAADKMNLALRDVGGELLVISQFTLLADTESGRRPSFIHAAPPDDARRLYELFVSLARNTGVRVETGEFGAMMQVALVNDGPVTIILDSKPQQGE